MALAQQKSFLGTMHSGKLLGLYLLGLVLVYVGERLIGEGTFRWILSGAGFFLVLLPVVFWLAAWVQSEGEARRVERAVAGFSFLGLLALVLIGVFSTLEVGPVAAKSEGVSLRHVATVLWLVMLCLAVVPLVFVHWSAGVKGRGRVGETRRLLASAFSGTTTALLLCSLFLINAIFNHKDIHADYSYFKTSSPSDGTKSMITGLDNDVDVLLFFPPVNEVLEEARSYFEELASLSPRFKIQVVDRAVSPDLAKTHRVGKDGTVVLARNENRQSIELGTDLEQAKLKLKKLDGDFQTAMLKLAKRQSVIYLTTGHGERSSDKSDADAKSRISLLKTVLQNNNFNVKPLGIAQGLGNAVPEDAAMIMMIGPTEPLFPGELQAIKNFLESGGHLLLMLDPGAKDNYFELLQFMGLKYSPDKLADEQLFATPSQNRSEGDKYNIVTESFTSHTAVANISRLSRELPVALPLTGSLEKAADTKRRVDFLVRSAPSTWADSDGDLKPGKDEKRKAFQLAAAVASPVEEKNLPKPKVEPSADKKMPGAEPKKEVKPEMRAVVFAGADAFGDMFLPFYGNRYLMGDVLRWLIGEDQIPTPPTSEEDVPVAHTHKQDLVWFYGMVFVVPILILVIGVLTRWGRGRRAGR